MCTTFSLFLEFGQKVIEHVAFVVQLLLLRVTVLHSFVHYFFVDLRDECNNEVKQNDKKNENVEVPNCVNEEKTHSIREYLVNFTQPIVHSWRVDVSNSVVICYEEVSQKPICTTVTFSI